MGYAIAGKPEIALQLFGKMRFQGIDLDGFTYHVLLNALVEQSCYDAVDVVVQQIELRGLKCDFTHSIIMKNHCKQGQLERAEESLRQATVDGGAVNGHSVGILVDALCKRNNFEKAARLLEEFKLIGMVRAEQAYGVWIQDLVQAGRVDGAIEFLRSKKDLEAYVPDVFKYNTLIYSLLRENRLHEVCDLVMEMKAALISPDEVTMNAVLCFFCKGGMVDVALELYNSRDEFGLSPNSMAYNFLINTLCGDGSVDEAYKVLKTYINRGYFPWKRTFTILADSLCREGKFDKMKELVVVALERNIMPSNATYDKFISALCRVQRVEDGYLIHGELNRLNKVSSKSTYLHLIHGFNKLNRGEIAARLLIEMQEKGHSLTQKLYRSVIRCLCETENSEKQFFKLLEMQVSHHEPHCQIYNYFIDGAGNAGKHELAREVYNLMVRSGVEPNLSSDILLLRSYLKSRKISEAVNFFDDLSKRRTIGRKLSNAMIVGLCKAERPDIALDILGRIREKNVVPSLECYEELVKKLSTNMKYSMVIELLDDFSKAGRKFSTFLCNMIMLHSLKNQGLFQAWVYSRKKQVETSSEMLDQLIESFSSPRLKRDVLEWENFVEQLFQPNLFTYNMLLRRWTMQNMDLVCELFSRLCQKGYEPNRWTYDIIVHGFLKNGRRAEARKWIDEMFRRGFDPTPSTKRLM